MDQYQNFEQLQQHNHEKRDYVIELRKGTSGITIMAPHGGAIEPGTATIANAIAGREHSYYAFMGLLRGRNNRLHISSVRFDEPRAMKLIGQSHTIITVHGCVGDKAIAYVGGRDIILKRHTIGSLLEAGIAAEESPGPWMRGTHPRNLCNRGTRGQGLQLEITAALRRRMLVFGKFHEPPGTTPLFHTMVGAIRWAIADLDRTESEKPLALGNATT